LYSVTQISRAAFLVTNCKVSALGYVGVSAEIDAVGFVSTASVLSDLITNLTEKQKVVFLQDTLEF